MNIEIIPFGSFSEDLGDIPVSADTGLPLADIGLPEAAIVRMEQFPASTVRDLAGPHNPAAGRYVDAPSHAGRPNSGIIPMALGRQNAGPFFGKVRQQNAAIGGREIQATGKTHDPASWRLKRVRT